jgi:hypothetical protein
MIFDVDSTSLSSNVAMAEGYDCSIGTALALIDSARNDYSMFEAMIGVEAKACQLENSGYTNESGEVMALQESAITGIFKKIGELLKKLAEKIKAIFHNFMSKINSLFLSDKQMVKKYEKEIYRKTNLGNLEIKWRNVLHDELDFYTKIDTAANEMSYNNIDKMASLYKKDSDKSERDKAIIDEYFSGYNLDEDDIHGSVIEYCLDDEEKCELKEVTSAREILSWLSDGFKKNIDKLQRENDKFVRKTDKAAKDFNKAGDNAIKAQKDKANAKDASDKDKEDFDNLTNKVNNAYSMVQSYQDVTIKINGACLEVVKIIYKYCKAAFMKMISANDKKLEESAVWADAIAEASANEVEDVLNAAISKEDLSETNNATKTLKGEGVSDDPNALVYADDPDYSKAKTSGTIDSNIVGKKESAYFSEMFY